MAGHLPPPPGTGRLPARSVRTQWAPVFPTQPPPHSRMWPAVMLAGIAALIAIAALIVSLARPVTAGTSTRTTPPSYTEAEVSKSQRQLCDTYKLAARSVQIDTNGTDKALARIALSNAAGMLDAGAADPAIDTNLRDAARELATAYRTSNAVSSGATDAEYQRSLDDIVAKDAIMKKACGGS